MSLEAFNEPATDIPGSPIVELGGIPAAYEFVPREDHQKTGSVLLDEVVEINGVVYEGVCNIRIPRIGTDEPNLERLAEGKITDYNRSMLWRVMQEKGFIKIASNARRGNGRPINNGLRDPDSELIAVWSLQGMRSRILDVYIELDAQLPQYPARILVDVSDMRLLFERYVADRPELESLVIQK